MTDYDTDIAAWAFAQADALRNRSVNKLDWEHLAEEIEALSRSDRRAIRNRLKRICGHLLKLSLIEEQEPHRGWRLTVIEQRQRVAELIEESPSLRDYPADTLAAAYRDARALVAEYGASSPDSCPRNY
jgi:hypothetical protein